MPMLGVHPGSSNSMMHQYNGSLREREASWERSFPGKQITCTLMLLAVFLLGNREILNYNTTIGYLFGLLLLPLWIAEFRRYRYGWLGIWITTACLVNGLWLSWYSSQTHVFLPSTFLGALGLFVGFIVTVMVLLWSRKLIPIPVLGLVYGLGMLTSLSSRGAAQDNFWKFSLAVPVTIIGLSLALSLRRRNATAARVSEAVVLLLLAVLSLLNDSRSMFGTLAVVLALVLWQLFPSGRSVRLAMVRSILTFGVLIVGVYNVGSALALEGLLGQAAQERSAMQIAMSGSLILGGRPEMMASFALIGNRPEGYGFGIVPQLSDIRVAKEGMATIGYNPDNGYVENYMFGNQFELHSTAADLWATMGLAGLILALILGIACILWVLHGISTREASALVLFLSIYTLWNLAFSPLYSALPTLGLAVGFMFRQRQKQRDVEIRAVDQARAETCPANELPASALRYADVPVRGAEC